MFYLNLKKKWRTWTFCFKSYVNVIYFHSNINYNYCIHDLDLIRNFKTSQHLQHFMIDVFRPYSLYRIRYKCKTNRYPKCKIVQQHILYECRQFRFLAIFRFQYGDNELVGKHMFEASINVQQYVCFGFCYIKSYFLMSWWWWRYWWCLHCSKRIMLHCRSGSLL